MMYLVSLKDFFHFEFLQYGLIAVILLGIICGILSPFIIAKKYAFIGEGVAHSTLLGLAITTVFLEQFSSLALFLCTLLITLILIIPLMISTYRQKIPSDSLIGIYLTLSLSTGIIILHTSPDSSGDILSMLLGNIFLNETIDIMILSILLLITTLTIFLNFKKWVFVCYDEENANTYSINTKLYHYIFFLLVTAVIVSAIKLAGAILINALLLIPGIFAYRVGGSMKEILSLSIVFSISSSVLGLTLANYWNLPPGATLALTQFSIFIILTTIFKKILRR